METFRFLEAFRSLHTRDSRQHALDALVGELSPYEWRALHALTTARTFQFDIVGQLPLELVAHIFAHLDITHPYRLQLVSRQWHHVLKSLPVLKVGLFDWNPDIVPPHTLDYATCRRMAKKIHAFRTGKPCSHFAIRFDRPVMDPILTRDAIVWCSEHVAPTDRVDSICVLNIRTWCFRKLRGDAREEVRSFIASDEIVALMTHTNMCYVWELHGDGFKKFRVPSQDYFKCTTCRDRTVACAAVSAEKTSVYIWNFDTSLGQSFEVESSRQLPMAGYRDRVM
ncbi:hypothetical protein NX059_006315 [Plenodomus lindquistii]|nr:hypothetical protein NX059_006315 [Plenodomus lindquistii]